MPNHQLSSSKTNNSIETQTKNNIDENVATPPPGASDPAYFDKQLSILVGENPQVKKPASVNYFDQNTENSIVKFQKEPDIEEKKRIFVAEIQPSFAKLIENIIFVYKFHTLGDLEMLKNDCLSFLFETLYKFDATKGHKAFSYFNVIAKNWFIQKVKIFKKKNKSDVHFDNVILNKLESDNKLVHNHEEVLLDVEFLMLLKDEVKKWRSKFDKKQEKMVLEAVILLLNNPDLISIYNKKGIYLYIREITGLNTKQVVTNLSKVKKKYDLFKKKYQDGEI